MLTKHGPQGVEVGDFEQAASHGLAGRPVMMPAPGAFQRLPTQLLPIQADDGSDSLIMLLELDKAVATFSVRLDLRLHTNPSSARQDR